MTSILTYPFITPYSVCTNCICNRIYTTPLTEWLLNGKIAENPVVVAPTTGTKVVEPSGINRYLQSVTVIAANTSTQS